MLLRAVSEGSRAKKGGEGTNNMSAIWAEAAEGREQDERNDLRKRLQQEQERARRLIAWSRELQGRMKDAQRFMTEVRCLKK